MYNDKRDTHSNDRVDSDNRSIAAANNEPAQKTQLTEANKDSRTLAKAISRLQVVRVPGRGKVSAREMIAVAIRQGEAFRRWREKGEPVGEIEVWVEGDRVMSVVPENSAALQDLTFRVPSPDTAVLQLTTVAQGERTVLYNLLLRDVPTGALRHRETWLNGQSMTLTITRLGVAAAAHAGGASHSEEMSHFRIKIAISPHATETATPTDSVRSERPPVTRDISDNERISVKDNPKAKAATAGAALLLLLCLGLSIGLSAKPTSLYRNWRQQRAALQTVDSDSSRGVAGASVEIASSERTNVSANTALEDPRGTATRESTLNPSHRKLQDSAGVATASYKKNDRFSKSGRHDPIAPQGAALLPWKMSIVPRLALLKNIYVKMDPQIAEPIGLKNLFVRTLEASDQFNVLADTEELTADGIVTLRFEPSSPCLGVVFAKVTGRDGKFLWQDFVWEAPQICVTVTSNSQDKMFIGASSALVDSLENTVRQAQETTQEKESFADGG